MDATCEGIKSEGETMLPENERLSIDQGSADSEISKVPRVEIPDDDLIVQILARLDGSSYSQALYQDAKSINENFLFPPHFPWHSTTRLSQKMMKTMPRDIDDLHAITHCQDELHAPFGDFQGPFGFGRYENGHTKGNYSNAPLVETLSLKPGSVVSAAARRSHDPGVLELVAQTLLPSSFDAINHAEDPDSLTPAEKWRAELLKDPDRAEILSHLPLHWSKRGKYSQSVGQRMDHPASGKQVSLVEQLAENKFELQKLTESRSRTRAQCEDERKRAKLELAKSCIRKWKISMKISGVSSRLTLFPSSTNMADTCDDEGMENTRNVIRPMLCVASLPQSIQCGQAVSHEKALEMDNSGFAHRLGSYDCRYTEALLNPKRDSVNRGKRIEVVGRTRLVWSNLIEGEEHFLPSTRGRISFNSLITGRRLDASKCKRPTEVRVGVRLNGRLLMERALEDLPTAASSNFRKRKHSTRQAENEGPTMKSHIQYPETRTDEEIDAALQNISILQFQPQDNQRIKKGSENGAVVYLEMGDQSLSYSDIDRNDIIATLLKFSQKRPAQKKLKRSASSEIISTEAAPTLTGGGSQFIKKFIPPRFACVPLEDGLLRTVCLSTGNMVGAPVHQVICAISEQEYGRRCSVCWSDEGSGKEGVQECFKCGLLAHYNCCLGKGEFSILPRDSHTDVDPKATKEDQCGNINGVATHSNAKTQVDIEPGDQTEQWQCAVCCHYTEMKPRRNPRMPSRFVDGETYALPNHAGDNDAVNRNLNTPGPRCSLCPHRGGAMSPLESSDNSDPKWAHEVCRIWSGFDLSEDSKMKECSSLFQQLPNGSPLSNVCALCGTSGLKGNKSMQFNAGLGLARCAARGCNVAFHPMCALLALLASKVGMDKKGGKAKSVRTRKTRHTEQAAGEKKSDVDESIEADRKLYKEYTLKLVQLTRATREEDKTTIVPVAFCGIHNPQREDRFYGCLPGGAAI